MNERRHEPFRYPFQTPLPGFYNKKFRRHISGPMEVKDISMNGLRFSCHAQPGLSMRDELFFSFIYKNETFTAEGRLIWMKTEGSTMTCGVHVFEYPDRLKTIIAKLGESLQATPNQQVETRSP
ncbi:PilZ domain-containing protein [Halobacillus karajensis]|uniref:PilZ domain-containing protein n=1 Tax=Halobacillus karajensis TaxID=195088 RepID=UPI0008A7E7EA|nr:PilZ domain-containing protein [Halobacillus karajensis]SEH45136.1 PilZ domain-containing protein [Halobacillus karajensis]